MKLIIDRLTWIRGNDEGSSCLLRSSDGHRCCLGFLANQAGLEDEAILNVDELGSVRNDTSIAIPEQLKFLIRDKKFQGDFNSDDSYRLMVVNDAPLNTPISDLDNDSIGFGQSCDGFSSEQDRETWLTTEFLKHGIEVEFIN